MVAITPNRQAAADALAALAEEANAQATEFNAASAAGFGGDEHRAAIRQASTYARVRDLVLTGRDDDALVRALTVALDRLKGNA